MKTFTHHNNAAIFRVLAPLQQLFQLFALLTLLVFGALAQASTPIVIDGPAVPVNLSPGQLGNYTFSGTAGQSLTVVLSGVGSATPSGAKIQFVILKPDGTRFNSEYDAAYVTPSLPVMYFPEPFLPVSGTYSLQFDPGTATTAINLTLVENTQGTLRINGPSQTFTINHLGQLGLYSFHGNAGDIFTLETSNNNMDGRTAFGSEDSAAGYYLLNDGVIYNPSIDPQPVSKTFTLYPLPANGSYILKVIGELGGFHANDSVTLALKSPNSPLTVTRSGNGTVSSVPAGIDCGVTCGASFATTSSITLSASPAAGSSFTGWSGACSGTAPCTLSMSSQQDVTANFSTLASSSTTLSATPNPSNSGQSITLSASVLGNNPSGSVNFTDNGNALCTAVPLSGSGNSKTASCSTSALTVGTHSLVANYSGDSGNLASTSTPTTQTVNVSVLPLVSLSAPADQAVYLRPVTLTLSATATPVKSGTTISKVEFYRDGTLIGSDTTSPYSFSWTPAAAGVYSLTAKATDSAGGVSISAARSVTINATNTVPTVSLTAPADGAVYNRPVTIALSANANGVESNTAISKVEFYQGTTLIASDTTAPYSVNWTPATVGVYSLTAKATDSAGGVTTSAARSVTINPPLPPTVSLTAPNDGATYTRPVTLALSASATANPGTIISKVEFYRDGVLIGSDTTSPYSFSWTPTAAGTYSLTAKATDSVGGVATSAARSITVNPPPPPTVSLTAPNAGATYTRPVTLALSATATANTGTTISKVEFYRDGVLIGSDTTSPYSFSWTPAAAGTYSLTAKATDSVGGVATSAARSITVNPPPPPTVSLTAPNDGATYSRPVTIAINATATTNTGMTISKVEFYQGTTLLGSDTVSPYSFSWTPATAGTFSLTAKATDSTGGVTTSAPRSVTVNASNTAPTVSLTAPSDGAVYSRPVTITLSANASGIETNTPISKVEFYQGTTLIGSDTTAPYSFSWTPAAAGTFSLTAKATDSAGGVTTSAARSVTINAANTAPTVSLTAPANAAVYLRPVTITLSADANGIESNTPISKVEFYAGTTLIASATTAPYSVSWTPAAAGVFNLTAKATDSAGGVTTSAARSVTINASNTAPTVSLTAPADNAHYLAPATVSLSASASDVELNTPISKVEFYQGSTLLGSSTASPYAFTWNNVAAGTYSLTAKATDSAGASSTSAAKSIVVEAGSAAAGLYFIQVDHLETPRLISDANGQTVWRWENTEAFGYNPPDEDPDGDGRRLEFNQRFPGQYFDRETGLSYNFFRDYDSATGRYTTSDPIGLGGGVNTYSYVEGNPVSKIDPRGLSGDGFGGLFWPEPEGSQYWPEGEASFPNPLIPTLPPNCRKICKAKKKICFPIGPVGIEVEVSGGGSGASSYIGLRAPGYSYQSSLECSIECGDRSGLSIKFSGSAGLGFGLTGSASIGLSGGAVSGGVGSGIVGISPPSPGVGWQF